MTGHTRRTKIVATIGPASASPETLAALINAGMDGARLNLSHGTREDHARSAALIREVEAAAGRPIALIADLQGPKLRVGDIPGVVVGAVREIHPRAVHSGPDQRRDRSFRRRGRPDRRDDLRPPGVARHLSRGGGVDVQEAALGKASQPG